MQQTECRSLPLYKALARNFLSLGRKMNHLIKRIFRPTQPLTDISTFRLWISASTFYCTHWQPHTIFSSPVYIKLKLTAYLLMARYCPIFSWFAHNNLWSIKTLESLTTEKASLSFSFSDVGSIDETSAKKLQTKKQMIKGYQMALRRNPTWHQRYDRSVIVHIQSKSS